MAITTWAQVIQKDKHIASVQKTTNVATQVATNWASTQSASGIPASALASAATVAVAGSGAGALFAKTAGAAGSLWFPDPGAGETVYLSNGAIANGLGASVGDCGMIHLLFDKVWGVNVAALTTLGTATITAPPSILSRMLNSSYANTMIVVEITTTISATATTVAVTYTNQSGVTGRTTGASPSLSGFALGRWVIMPLQAGDTGVQKIETIVVGGVVATAGAVNVLIVKPYNFGLATGAYRYEMQGYERCGMVLNPAAALYVAVLCNGTSTGQLDAQYEIIDG